MVCALGAGTTLARYTFSYIYPTRTKIAQAPRRHKLLQNINNLPQFVQARGHALRRLHTVSVETRVERYKQ